MNKDRVGIYKIVCSATGKRYVGSSGYIYKRWSEHRCALRKGKHHSRYLQSAWNKHGEEKFTFWILEECERSMLFEREQFWIDELKPEYNSSDKAVVTQYWVETQLPRRAAITHCPRGHIYNEKNTMIHQGKRVCRTCNRERVSKIYLGETAEQREKRRSTVLDYQHRMRDQIRERNNQYAAEHREQKREYDRKRYEQKKLLN